MLLRPLFIDQLLSFRHRLQTNLPYLQLLSAVPHDGIMLALKPRHCSLPTALGSLNMRIKCWFIIVSVALSTWSGASAQTPVPLKPAAARIMRNRDVLSIVRTGVKPAEIVARIKSSHCNFDIFPPVLDDLRRRGVPDVVLEMMVQAPNGPPETSIQADLTEVVPTETVNIKIPSGTPVEIETIYPVSSADVVEGGSISFAVVNPIFVDGILAIARGAVAKARIVRAKKAQSWGRAGALYWEMDYVIAVDGTRLPLRLADGSEGGNRSAHLAAGAAVTSALVFPYTAPIALVWGFKKGDDAVLRGSRQFSAVLHQETPVLGIATPKDRVIYHYADALKSKTTGTPVASFPRLSVKPGFQ